MESNDNTLNQTKYQPILKFWFPDDEYHEW